MPAALVLTSSLGSRLQPCNPAVGGPAKSQLVHEIDALGGEIGRMADRCYLQKRVLNASKVPAHPMHADVADVTLPRHCHVLPTCCRDVTAGEERYTCILAGCSSVLGSGKSGAVRERSMGVQGPAVWALRAQTDKVEYATVMRRILEATPNLFMREGMAVDLDVGPNNEVLPPPPPPPPPFFWTPPHCILDLLRIRLAV